MEAAVEGDWFGVFENMISVVSAVLSEVPETTNTLRLLGANGVAYKVTFRLCDIIEAFDHDEDFEAFARANVTVVHAVPCASLPAPRSEFTFKYETFDHDIITSLMKKEEEEEEEEKEKKKEKAKDPAFASPAPLPRPKPALPGTQQLCIQCQRRKAVVESLTCKVCKRTCKLCKKEPCLGKRDLCYDCIWKEGAGFPICPRCQFPSKTERKSSEGIVICINCYRKERRPLKTQKEEEAEKPKTKPKAKAKAKQPSHDSEEEDESDSSPPPKSKPKAKKRPRKAKKPSHDSEEEDEDESDPSPPPKPKTKKRLHDSDEENQDESDSSPPPKRQKRSEKAPPPTRKLRVPQPNFDGVENEPEETPQRQQRRTEPFYNIEELGTPPDPVNNYDNIY